MSEMQIDPGHKGVRDILRIVGPIIAVVGLIFMIVAFVDFIRAFNGSGPPERFWCFLVGGPLLVVGFGLTSHGYLGRLMRYQAGEMAPVAKDTFNYMADGTKEGVKTIASALGQGLKEGGFGAAGAVETKVRCHKCNALAEDDAKFCGQCGQPLEKSKACPACRELNDPDAKFCDNCGHAYT